MNHILLKNKEEHWDWCFENYLKYYNEHNPSPWSEEDKKILQPFFDWTSSRKGAPGPMPVAVQRAFDYYCTVSEKGMTARERIDFTQRVSRDQLLEYFGFERKYESDFDTDEAYEAYEDSLSNGDYIPELSFSLSYPCIMISSLEADYDRLGPVTKAVVDYVSLDEFKEVIK